MKVYENKKGFGDDTMLNMENKIESLKKYFSEQPNVLGAWI